VFAVRLKINETDDKPLVAHAQPEAGE